MQPQNLIFGGGATATRLHPLIAVWMLIAIACILFVPRNRAIVPFLLAFFTIPFAQVVVVGGIHFPVIRILILAGLARAAVGNRPSGPRFAGGFNGIDTVVVLWTVSALAIASLQWMAIQPFIKFVGDFLDSFGGYVAVRYFIPDREALRRAVKVLAVICLILGVCMMSEQFTHQNVFGFLGANEPALREGHIRSEGILGSIQGGTFGGVLIPMFLWLWTEKRSRLAASFGLVGATAMVFASHASTSWLAYAAGLGGLAFWVVRERMRLMRWGLVIILTGLHLVMHGPVWSLIEKIDITGGSSSYHRYMLVDNCIRHFTDWWLLGYKDYGSWGFDMWDLCNQFVAVALTGGLLSLILFIMIYSRSFGAIGDARKLVSVDRKQEWLLWCLGSTLFANVVASFGINYMVQLEMLIFPLLACVSVAICIAERAEERAPDPRTEDLAVAVSHPVGACLSAQKN
jgi:hypothetical protein